MGYETEPTKRYQTEEVWFPLSEDILAWDQDFHQLMLNDRLRMVAYEAAIKEVVKSGMTVADLGTGTGILAKWALEAGAMRVYGIDVNAEILKKAHERMRQTGLEDRYTTFNGLSYDVMLPERVDIIMSEILGNLADNEDMTPILADARARWLKPTGVMLPQAVDTYLLPISSPSSHQQIQEKRCRGINSRYQLQDLLVKLWIDSPFNLYYDVILPQATYLAKPQKVQQFYFNGADQATYEVERSYVIDRDDVLTGFKGYFVAQLSPNVALDIGESDIANRQTSDCWKHCYLPIEEPIVVKTGDLLSLTYSRYYPTNRQSPFRQCYSWKGVVRRGSIAVGHFQQEMS